MSGAIRMTHQVTEPDDMDRCGVCGATAHALEYDVDEDVYTMLCDNEHETYVRDSSEPWK